MLKRQLTEHLLALNIAVEMWRKWLSVLLDVLKTNAFSQFLLASHLTMEFATSTLNLPCKYCYCLICTLNSNKFEDDGAGSMIGHRISRISTKRQWWLQFKFFVRQLFQHNTSVQFAVAFV